MGSTLVILICLLHILPVDGIREAPSRLPVPVKVRDETGLAALAALQVRSE